MSPNVLLEIAELQDKTVSQLVQRYEQVFEEECRSRNKQYLIRRIAWRLQANEEGGLSRAALKKAEELAIGAETRVTAPRKHSTEGVKLVHPEPDAYHQAALKTQGNFTADFLHMAERDGSELQRAIENVLKGPELKLPAGHFILDKANHKRDTVRIKWYESGAGRTYREHHLGSDEVPDVAINANDLETFKTYSSDAAPVFVGHYWLTGTPKPLATNVACTDYSVAKGGKLVAYRWDGEPTLHEEKFHWVGD